MFTGETSPPPRPPATFRTSGSRADRRRPRRGARRGARLRRRRSKDLVRDADQGLRGQLRAAQSRDEVAAGFVAGAGVSVAGKIIRVPEQKGGGLSVLILVDPPLGAVWGWPENL